VLKIDEIAERILTLAHTPEHNYSVYTQLATIKESSEVTNGVRGVEIVLESFKTIIVLQREILELTDEANDEGTNALMSDYIREQEKLVWMYSSFLNK
jgi:starvation-inducible DNA-binding protein